ncbi:MAG: GNAT family N-acetyltransferase [Rhodobiaceae bacterium]|nr:GNAT family N-acetyltransferase [Rhodobiaceae bacterium]
MLRVVTRQNASLYEDKLEQMFRLRHRVLVDIAGWEEIRQPDGREIDQFDNDLTTYFLILDDKEDVVGSLRMQPSLAPTLTSEVFPSICDIEGVPRSDRLYDCSRVIAAPEVSQKEGQPSWVTSELHSGMFEFGLALGLEGLTCVLEVKWLHYMKRWNWDVRPLGMPDSVSEGGSVAACIHTTVPMLEMLRETRGLTSPVISPGDLGLVKANHELMHATQLTKLAA